MKHGHLSAKAGGRGLFTDPVLAKIGAKYGKTVAQVILRWHLQRGIAVIPKSTHIDRMEENFNVFDFTLSADDMKEIAALDKEAVLLLLPIPTRICGVVREDGGRAGKRQRTATLPKRIGGRTFFTKTVDGRGAKMKKFFNAALSLLLSVSAVFAFAACETSGGTGDTGESGYAVHVGRPFGRYAARLLFVVGQHAGNGGIHRRADGRVRRGDRSPKCRTRTITTMWHTAGRRRRRSRTPAPPWRRRRMTSSTWRGTIPCLSATPSGGTPRHGHRHLPRTLYMDDGGQHLPVFPGRFEQQSRVLRQLDELCARKRCGRKRARRAVL